MASPPKDHVPVPEPAGGWNTEEAFWRDAFRERPYARPGHTFERYQRAYRHGWEGAHRHRDAPGWADVESDMRYGWEHHAERGSDWSAWEEIKDAVKDAFERGRRRR